MWFVKLVSSFIWQSICWRRTTRKARWSLKRLGLFLLGVAIGQSLLRTMSKKRKIFGQLKIPFLKIILPLPLPLQFGKLCCKFSKKLSLEIFLLLKPFLQDAPCQYQCLAWFEMLSCFSPFVLTLRQLCGDPDGMCVVTCNASKLELVLIVSLRLFISTFFCAWSVFISEMLKRIARIANAVPCQTWL